MTTHEQMSIPGGPLAEITSDRSPDSAGHFKFDIHIHAPTFLLDNCLAGSEGPVRVDCACGEFSAFAHSQPFDIIQSTSRNRSFHLGC